MSFASISAGSFRTAIAAAFFAIVCAAAANAATPCPRALFLESSNGRYYVAVFAAPAPLKSSIGLTFYSKSNAYSLSLNGISIEKPFDRGGSDKGFRSFTALLQNPGNDPLLGAIVRPYDIADGTICPPEDFILPTIDEVKRRDIEPAEKALIADVASEAGDGSNAFSLAPVPMQTTFDCPTPFAHASIVSLVKPDASVASSPAAAPSPAATAYARTALVRVDLSATGSVVQAAIAKTSGDPDFDRASVASARKTTYAPRIFGCVKEPASYVYVGRD